MNTKEEVKKILLETLAEAMDELEVLLTSSKHSVDLLKLSIKEMVLLEREVRAVVVRLKSYK